MIGYRVSKASPIGESTAHVASSRTQLRLICYVKTSIASSTPPPTLTFTDYLPPLPLPPSGAPTVENYHEPSVPFLLHLFSFHFPPHPPASFLPLIFFFFFIEYNALSKEGEMADLETTFSRVYFRLILGLEKFKPFRRYGI